jgi:hypothetical protein
MELKQIKASQPELESAVDMQLALVEMQRRVQGRVPLPWIQVDPAWVTEQQRAGRPLVRFRDIPLEWSDFRLTFRQTADILLRNLTRTGFSWANEVSEYALYLITLLTAIIAHVYSLSFWMHSDALFCLLTTGAMVLACQINEGRSHVAWRTTLLVVLCIAAQLVRWAGALQWLVIAGVLIRGYPLPLNRKLMAQLFAREKLPTWTALLVSGVLT